MNAHDLIQRLNAAGIAFTLATVRECAIMIVAVIPGERWEIECFPDGRIEVEVFRSDGDIRDGTVIDALIERFKD